MRRRLALLLGLLVVAALAGCGGGASGDAGADPASITPRSAPFYVEATVRPEGDLRSDLLAAAGKILGTQQPEAELRKLFDRLTEGENVDYDRDIKPWLGERAGVWGEISTASGSAEANRFAAIIAATDVEKALETIEKGARSEGTKFQSRSYSGTEYLFDPSDATGLAGVEDFVVIATEAELKRTIDAAKGDGLSSSDKYKDTVGDLPDARAGLFYVDAGPLLAKEVSAADLGPLAGLFDPRRIPPVAGALLANGERVALEARVKLKGNPLLGALGTLGGAPRSQLLQELPGDTSAAFGIPALGKTAKTLFNQFAGAFGGAAVSAQLKQQTGLDLERDVFAWIGDVAVFVRGTGSDGLEGGLVIEVVDKAAAAGAFGKLVALARTRAPQLRIEPARIDGAESAFTVTDAEIPKEIVVARSADRVVLAYGKASAAAALSPDAKLGDAETWDEVGQTLGDGIDPSVFVDMQWLLANLDAFGAVAGEPDFAQVRPYLERLSVIAIGASGDEDDSRSSFAVGFK